jgi:hypothetical protein
MSTTETDELVKRLEEIERDAKLGYEARTGRKAVTPFTIEGQAADRLVSLKAERDAAIQNRNFYADERKRVRAEEREACANIADATRAELTDPYERAIAAEIAGRIREGAQVEHLSQPSPAGWQLVPIEPTPMMVALGREARASVYPVDGTVECYRAMLAAAPSAPPRASHPGDRIGDDKSEYGHEG